MKNKNLHRRIICFTINDLLLEAGVFLVSVQLILMAYDNKQNQIAMMREFKDIKAFLEEEKNSLKQHK
ncbi:MAG: hypothetical protein JSV11_09560 [Nitrospiraceae bacterium]|nr:MAG: hypothetical protein JSV11_09560 [Nitrospiraceae bacterium]